MVDEVYFWGSKLASFARSTSSVIESTQSGSYDSAYVANSIKVEGSGTYIESPTFVDAATATTLSLTVSVYRSSAIDANQVCIAFINGTGTTVARVIGVTSSTVKFQYWDGSTYVDSGAAVSWPNATLTRFSWMIVCGASGSMAWYSQGASATSGSISSASTNNIAQIRFSSPDNGVFGIGYYSDFVCANFDTRDHHWRPRQLNGAGTYTDNTGTYADINDTTLNEATAVALLAIGEKGTFTHAADTVPVGYQIRHVGVGARVRVSGGVVTDAKFLAVSGASEQATAVIGPTEGYEPRLAYWTNDPDTATDWTQSGWNAAEIGLEAV